MHLTKFIRKVINYRSSVQTSLKVDKDNLVLVYSNGCLHAVSSIDGEILWKKDLTTEGFENSEVNVSI